LQTKDRTAKLIDNRPLRPATPASLSVDKQRYLRLERACLTLTTPPVAMNVRWKEVIVVREIKKKV
jgi:hypothetical protein